MPDVPSIRTQRRVRWTGVGATLKTPRAADCFALFSRKRGRRHDAHYGCAAARAIPFTLTRARAVGFAYSWSGFFGDLRGFQIAAVLKQFGTVGVFEFIASAMLIVMVAIGLMGPRSRGLQLEEISK